MDASEILQSMYIDLPCDQDVVLTENILAWTDNFGAENSVSINDIAFAGDKAAWWQCNAAGRDLVLIRLHPTIVITLADSIEYHRATFPGKLYNIFLYK